MKIHKWLIESHGTRPMYMSVKKLHKISMHLTQYRVRSLMNKLRCLFSCLKGKFLISLVITALFFLCVGEYSMNRLSSLPRGFGSLPALEVLDLTYNNLNESSLPGNFFYLSKFKNLYPHCCGSIGFMIL